MPSQQLFIRGTTKIHGPFDVDHVRAAAAKGEIAPEHQLSFDGQTWFPAAKVWNQLVPQTASTIASFAVESAPPPARPVSGAPRSVPPPLPSRSAAIPPPSKAQPATYVAAPYEPPDFPFYTENNEPKGSGSAARVLLLVCTYATLLIFLSMLTLSFSAAVYDEPPQGGFQTILVIVAWLLGFSAVVVALAGIAASIVLAVWTFQAGKAMRAAGVTSLTISPWAAAVGMFVPFVNLFLPFLAWRELAIRGGERDDEKWRSEDALLWINGAWITQFVMLASVVGRIVYFIGKLAVPVRSAEQQIRAAQLAKQMLYWQTAEMALIAAFLLSIYYAITKLQPVVAVALVPDDD